MFGQSNNPFATMNNHDEDMRETFILKMNEFADTIESSPSGDMLTMMLSPYLSSVGLTDLIPILSSEVMVFILREAADSVIEDEYCEGIVFAYYVSESINIVMFNFKNGKMATKKHKYIKDDTLAGSLFLETLLSKSLSDAAEDFNAQPLYESSKILCEVV